MERFRAGIIGCGRVASLLEDDPLEQKPCTHAGAYSQVGEVALVAAADLDEQRLAAFGRRWGVRALYPDYRRMLAEERLEIVSLCAYAPSRCQMVLDVVEAGVKGIWCEKALATSLAEADAMIAACRRHRVSLIVNHCRRWSPEYLEARRLIREGGIGRLHAIVGYCSGNLVHTGTHLFDVFRLFAGEARWVEGHLDPEEIGCLEASGYRYAPEQALEDVGGYGTVGFDDGVIATVHGRGKGYFFFELDLVGSEGRIRIGNNDLLELWTRGESRHYTGFWELHLRRFPLGHPLENAWVAAVRELISCIQEGRESSSNGHDGRAALEMALAFHQSHLRGGTRVELPLAGSELRICSR